MGKENAGYEAFAKTIIRIFKSTGLDPDEAVEDDDPFEGEGL